MENVKGKIRMATANSQGSEEKISLLEKFAYGMGDFWTSIVFTILSAYLLVFYVDVMKIPAAMVGSVMLVVRLLDGVTDLGIGALVDRTKTKHGKARPWLLWGGVPFGLSLMLLFYVPDFGLRGQLIYIFFTYFLITTVYSAVNIPYGALNALITKDSYEKTVLNIFRMTSAYVGGVVIHSIAMPLINSFDQVRTGWFVTFALVGVLIPLGYGFTFYFTKERVKPSISKKNSKITLKRELNALIRNKFWVILVILSLFTWLNSGITNGLNAFMATTVLGDSNLIGVLGNIGLVPLIIGVPLMAPVIKRFGKRNAVFMGALLTIPASLVFLIDPTNPNLLFLSVALRAFASVPGAAAMNPMLTDTIDYGEWKFGIRSEGLVFSASSFGMKVGVGLGSAAMGGILALANYNANLATQSDFTITALVNAYVWIPIVLAICQLILLSMYKLDPLHEGIVRELDEVAEMS